MFGAVSVPQLFTLQKAGKKSGKSSDCFLPVAVNANSLKGRAVVAPDRVDIRFSGKSATQAAQGVLMSKHALVDALRADTDPYVGQLPASFQVQTKMPAERILTYLDDLADRLSVYPARQDSIDPAIETSLARGYVGEGNYGKVYRIMADGKAYAFKVFHPYHKRDFSLAAFSESAIGAFFTARNSRDFSRFYAANPSQGWTLMEYIDKETDTLASRSGKTLSEQDYEIDDDAPRNRVNQIRVDHGGSVSYQGKIIHQYW